MCLYKQLTSPLNHLSFQCNVRLVSHSVPRTDHQRSLLRARMADLLAALLWSPVLQVSSVKYEVQKLDISKKNHEHPRFNWNYNWLTPINKLVM